MSHLNAEKTRLSEELKQALEHTIELEEQVDAALGADQMVSILTQKNLELEEAVEKLTEERNDLVRLPVFFSLHSLLLWLPTRLPAFNHPAINSDCTTPVLIVE